VVVLVVGGDDNGHCAGHRVRECQNPAGTVRSTRSLPSRFARQRAPSALRGRAWAWNCSV